LHQTVKYGRLRANHLSSFPVINTVHIAMKIKYFIKSLVFRLFSTKFDAANQMPTYLTKYQIDKIGNSIIHLGDSVSELSKTKLLKLLFLLEEKSIQDYGTPFFGVDFKIWQFGPVAPPLFEGLTESENKFLSDYIQKNKFDEYEGKKEFVDDEFSDNDLTVLKWAVDFARHKTAEDLVEYTHSPTSLWRRGAIKHNVYDKFKKKELTYTNYDIDFTLLFEKDSEGYLLEKYNSAIENLNFSKKYKELVSV